MSEIRFNEKYFKSFVDTAIERHRIYELKERGVPKPWTDNLVLRNYFFCNVFRQYDKCSKWIIEKIIPYQRWELLIVYRFISTYETFKRIEETCELDDLESIHKLLANMKKDGEKLFSGCFIRNPRVTGGWTETYNVPFCLIKEIKDDGRMEEHLKKNSLEDMVEYLSLFSGTKGFMGYEYASDFAYSDFFNPTDRYSWANMGPGAMRGMSLILNGYAFERMNQATWLERSQIVLRIMKKEMNIHFPEEDVTMREVEHWLCEFQKYVKYCQMDATGLQVKHRTYNGGF